MIGETVRHYRILEKLGEGGMGVVYKALDTNLDRTVAIKFLATHLLASEEHRARLLREARAVASLDHPNICQVYEVGEAGGQLFLVFPYIDGPEVRARIAERPLKLEEALDIAIQTAEGLRTAHQSGIVHRDIKSSNLMLTQQGTVKIMDFGLAQAADAARITRSGLSVGTPAYMSPEQAQGRPTDRRTDIWSLGVVLYEMVCGRLPFGGEREAAITHAIVYQRHEPVTSLRAGLPIELDWILAKALAKDPAERYQHVDDLLVDLRGLQSDSPRRATPRRRIWAWAAVVPILALTVYFARSGWNATPAGEPMRATPLTTLPGSELYPSLSPDGRYVAFTWTAERQENASVYVQQIDVGAPLRVTKQSGNDRNPVWSPDGRWIAFLRGDAAKPLTSSDLELLLIPPLGGAERKIADVRVQELTMNPAFLDWCPDSKCLIVTDTTGEGKPDALFTVSIETGEKRRLTDPPASVLADSNPAISPDGASLLFLRRSTWGLADMQLLALNHDMTAAGQPKAISVQSLKPDQPAWMPGSREILFSTPNMAGGTALYRLRLGAGYKPVRLPYVGEDGIQPDISPTQPGQPARLVFVRSFTDENVWRLDSAAAGMPAASAPKLAISSTRADIHPQISPAGDRVAFTSTRSGAWEIWTSRLDGSDALKLTSLEPPTGSGVPHWSPDGKTVAFASDAEGQFDIFVVSAAGGTPKRLTSDPAFDHVPSFSRDGRWIYFSSARGGQYHVWKAPAMGGQAERVTRDAGWYPLESVDGKYLYYVSTPEIGEPGPLWRIPTAGGPPEKLIDAVINSSFDVVRTGIYYVTSRGGGITIEFYDLASRRSTVVARDLANYTAYGGFAVSPDGRTILIVKRDAAVDDLMLVENFR